MSRLCAWILFWLLAPAVVALGAAPWKVEPEAIEFGPSQPEQLLKGSVKLTNTGDASFLIKTVSADCSCTAANPDKTDLAPGESTTISVALETRHYRGEVTRRVHVQTTAGDIVIPVRTAVTAFPNWVVSPLPLFLKPSLRKEPSEGTISLQFLGKNPVKIEKITASVPWLEARLAPVAQGQTFTLQVNKLLSAPAGYHSAKIMVETDDPQARVLDLQVYVLIRSTLTVVPNPLVMPAVKAGETTALRGKLVGLDQAQDFELTVTAGTITRAPAISASGECNFEIKLRVETPGTATHLMRMVEDGGIVLEAPIIVRGQP